MSLENQFEQELHNRAENIDKLLESYLPKEEGWAKCVAEAMNYSITAKGKRLRPMLMQETYQMFGGTGKEIMPFMAAIEMIHTYSLVHDDLPAMDNDEYRRGRKTTHVVYGEAMAILAGDGLLNYAFETALQAFAIESIDTAKAVKALTILAGKAGIYGMIGGQTADIEAENLGNQVTEEHLLFIHEHKTAALIQAAMMIGAVLGGADEAQTAVVEQAAYEIGIAFQIQDDILERIPPMKFPRPQAFQSLFPADQMSVPTSILLPRHTHTFLQPVPLKTHILYFFIRSACSIRAVALPFFT